MTTDRAARARFDAVYARARDPLARYLARRCRPETVEDLFQEVMTVCWRRLDEIPDGDEVPWLFGVARRTLANHRRANGRLGRLLEALARVTPAVDPGPEPAPGPDPDLAAALAALRSSDAEILRLWAWEELAPREIALVLGISPNAASICLHRAKARLGLALGRHAAAASDADGKAPVPPGHLAGVEREEAR